MLQAFRSCSDAESVAHQRTRCPLAFAALAVFSCLAVACDGTSPEQDGGLSTDARAPADSGDAILDSGAPDAGAPFTVSIVSPESPVVANDGEIVIRAFVDGASPELINLRLDGDPLASVPPPFEHTLDLASLSEAEHRVVASATVDGATVESEPLLVIVDRTAPSVVAIDPPTSELYRLGAVVTVTFDEALDPESVAAPSTGLALGSGTAFDSTLELDATGTVLTITPTGPDSIADGTVELLLGVTDPTGNPVMPFEGVWDSPRWTPVGRAITFDAATEYVESRADLQVRVGSTGDLFVASLGRVLISGAPVHFVRVVRFDGATWTAVGDRVCEGTGIAESTGAVLGGWDFELEPDDTPVVAVRNISDLAVPFVRFCRFSAGAWMEEPTVSVPPWMGTNLRQFDFDIGSGGERSMVAEMGDADSSYRTPFIWERPAGGTWGLVSDELRHDYVHLAGAVTRVRYDRLGRITVLPLLGSLRVLGYLDGATFVLEATAQNGAGTRLVETPSTRTMLTGCRLVDPTGEIYSHGLSYCDLVAGASSERRLMAYSDAQQLGLVHETAPGVFTDLGAQFVHATATGEACASPSVECRVASFELSLAIARGRVIAIPTPENPIAFDLNTFGTVP